MVSSLSRAFHQNKPAPAAIVGADESPHAAELAASLSKPAKSRYEFAGYERWKAPDGYPAVKPPWGTLSAIDMNTGEYRWRITLGAFPALTSKGVAATGTEQYGGPIVTAGGLVFIAATQDAMIRAFDKLTGALLNVVASRTRSLGACSLAHAVANLLLGLYVLRTGQWGFW
jgi:quinoprotein glucose dehydrogenase